jgi:arylsulfatase A-like enzyme
MTALCIRVVLLLAAAIAAVVDRSTSARALDHRPAENVVVVTLDTTRADRLSPYGLMDVEMPALDRLAREGVVFDQATTVAPLTLPAHASLFTGLFPQATGVRDNGSRGLGSAFTTLAEVLRARDYRTGAFVGSVVLGADRGLTQGFERYADVASGMQRPANLVVDDAIQWLESTVGRAPFFIWAHLYDPHRPYSPPEPFRTRHADPYIGEIAFADAQIGRLLDWLDAQGLAERTVVVVVGDHGESLGDHGERDHGVLVYQSVLRVPLIVRAPGLSPGRVPDVVRIVDVMPTVLDRLRLDAHRSDGVSLVPLLTGRQIGTLDLEAYAESEYGSALGCAPRRTLRAGRYKLIAGPRVELFDLERDPFEQNDLSQARTATAAAMARRLEELARGRPIPSGGGTPDAGHAARLAALGYVAATPALQSTPAASDIGCDGLR